MKNNSIQITCYLFICVLFFACKKDWLEAKPEKKLVVPSTIRDFQALLDNTNTGGSAPFNVDQSIIDEHNAGDFYLLDVDYNARSPYERNNYRWAPDIYENTDYSGDWSGPYKRIYYTNIVIEGIENISPGSINEQIEWNQVKGGALFLRAFNHFQIAKLYCKAYDQNTASSDLGIPLRLTSDFNVKSFRSNVQKSYDQILGDLKVSSSLLPVDKPINEIYKLRPNKAAAFAMIARVYLSMDNYDSALVYANMSLQLYNKLIDFNTLPVTASNFPITILNDEVLFHATGTSWLMYNVSRMIVDSTLYGLCSNSDLRKSVFFKPRNGTGPPRFYGSYSGSNSLLFTGLATDEVYLIKAECHARKGNISEALTAVNTLYQKRWKNSVPFQAINANTANEALVKIILERRKELCFRGIRWTDLKRLNKDPQFTTTLTKVINSVTYTLTPGSPLYILPIPHEVIYLSGIEQNIR